MNDDVRTMKNIRERPTKEMLVEYKTKEKQQREISKAHKGALREEKRRGHIGKLQAKKVDEQSRLQEKVELQKQKAEIRRLKQETGVYGKARKLQKQIKARQQAIQKRGIKPSVATTKKIKTEPKIYIIKGVAYHYKGGKMIKVPIGKAKPKKKKEDWTL